MNLNRIKEMLDPAIYASNEPYYWHSEYVGEFPTITIEEISQEGVIDAIAGLWPDYYERETFVKVFEFWKWIDRTFPKDKVSAYNVLMSEEMFIAFNPAMLSYDLDHICHPVNDSISAVHRLLILYIVFHANPNALEIYDQMTNSSVGDLLEDLMDSERVLMVNYVKIWAISINSDMIFRALSDAMEKFHPSGRFVREVWVDKSKTVGDVPNFMQTLARNGNTLIEAMEKQKSYQKGNPSPVNIHISVLINAVCNWIETAESGGKIPKTERSTEDRIASYFQILKVFGHVAQRLGQERPFNLLAGVL